MKLSFTARHFKAPERLKDYAEKKVKRLEKYYDGILDCEVVLDYEKLLQVAEIIVRVYGTRLTVVEKSDDIFKSIDLAVDKMERQLKKYKEKLREFEHQKATTPPPEMS